MNITIDSSSTKPIASETAVYGQVLLYLTEVEGPLGLNSKLKSKSPISNLNLKPEALHPNHKQ